MELFFIILLALLILRLPEILDGINAVIKEIEFRREIKKDFPNINKFIL